MLSEEALNQACGRMHGCIALCLTGLIKSERSHWAGAIVSLRQMWEQWQTAESTQRTVTQQAAG